MIASLSTPESINGDYEKRRQSIKRLPTFYRNLGGQLFDQVIEECSETQECQNNVFAELALYRHHASVAAMLYQQSIEQHNSVNTSESLSKVLAHGEMLTDCLDKVTRCATLSATISKQSRDKYSQGDVQDIINSLVAQLYDVCGNEYQHVANAFEEKISQELDFVIGATELTPDQTAMMMDQTIPFIPDSDIDPTLTSQDSVI